MSDPTWEDTIPSWDDTLPEQQTQAQTPTQPDSSMGDVATLAVKEALFQPGTMMADAATNPVTQAKMLPPLAGAVGGIMGGPFSVSRAQLPARALSDAALTAYGRSEEIPSVASHVGEAVGTLAADVLAVPYAHKAVAGKRIGVAEKTAGVITRAPEKLPTAGNVGEYLNTLESQLDSGTVNTAQAARDAVAGMRYINGNPQIVGKSSDIAVQAARVGQKAQQLLNKVVPGRLGAAKEMARTMQVPNAIGRAIGKVWAPVRRNALPLAVLEEFVRRGLLNKGGQ